MIKILCCSVISCFLCVCCLFSQDKKIKPSPAIQEIVIPNTTSYTISVSTIETPVVTLETPTFSIKKIAENVKNYKIAKGTETLSNDVVKRNKEIRDLVVERLDIDEISKLSLGVHWQKRTRQEQEYFVSLLRRLFERITTSKENKKFFGDYKINYDKEVIDKDKAVVLTTVKSKDVDVGVEYKLKFSGKIWKVYDIVVDDVSTIENFNSQFDSIITEESYQKLVKKLEDKLKE